MHGLVQTCTWPTVQSRSWMSTLGYFTALERRGAIVARGTWGSLQSQLLAVSRRVQSNLKNCRVECRIRKQEAGTKRRATCAPRGHFADAPQGSRRKRCDGSSYSILLPASWSWTTPTLARITFGKGSTLVSRPAALPGPTRCTSLDTTALYKHCPWNTSVSVFQGERSERVARRVQAPPNNHGGPEHLPNLTLPIC